MKHIKVLLLTGQSNHDWKRSAPYCKELLEKSGRFKVKICENPSEQFENMEKIRQYDLLFMDYFGEAWSEVARLNFEKAVYEGKGLVILHGSTVGFKGWVEYEKMAALLWRDGSNHGDYHEFKVNIINHDHPITKGIQDFFTCDELYHRLVPVHNVPYLVLANAYSSPQKRGTGNYEPMMIVSEYGKGKVFYQILGHVWPKKAESDELKPHCQMTSYENEYFQKTLLRGCEWAVTGAVTLP